MMPDVSAQKTEVQIRWMITRDMPDVLAIEKESFDFAWSEDDFLACLRQRNCIGMVAVTGAGQKERVGFMIYELYKAKLHVLNFAVAARSRRSGVGTQMVAKLILKLSQQRRRQITLEVRETNIQAQLFFRRQSFRALCVLRDHYLDTCEDAYFMQYSLDAAEERHPHVNRITGHFE
jgi:ribosomal-protein-alanine N-acetyltransferase